MHEILQGVRGVVADELKRASEKRGERFHSTHEAYAVILEEATEAQEQKVLFDGYFEGYWFGVMNDGKDTRMDMTLERMEEHALNACAEWAQVAAMIKKAKRGFTDGTEQTG